MIKIQIDPITKKVLCYTKVAPNTQIYKSDILVEESAVPEFDTPCLYVDGEFIEITDENYDGSLERLNSQIAELSQVDDNNYFINLYMEGKSMTAARTATLERKEQRELLYKQREQLLAEHQENVTSHYLAENRKLDSALDCKYYSSVILLGGRCRRDETNAEIGRSPQGTVRGRKRKADETEYVQGGIESKGMRPIGAIRLTLFFCVEK